MSYDNIDRWLAAILCGLGIAALACPASAQVSPSYGQYFQQQVSTYGKSGPPGPNRYLYDKYFYQRPTVSPYINVFRPDTPSGTAYQSYVRPELQRREASAAASKAYVQQRKLEGRVGDTRYPGAGFVGGTPSNAYLKPGPTTRSTPSAYYNHWYGGWNKR